MDMRDNDREIVIGVGIGGEIEWRLIVRKRVLEINWYVKHFRVGNDSVFVGWVQLNKQCTAEKVQPCTHINNRQFLPFISCIVVYVDD